jgi:hypothetical protein
MEGSGTTMKRALVGFMSITMVFAFTSFSEAAAACPPEVSQAKEMLAKKGTTAAKRLETHAPRSLAGARQDIQQTPRGQDVQTPRGQDVQTPRGQDVQTPRGQDVQTPRGQDVQTPRGQDPKAPRSAGASKVTSAGQAADLIKEAEAACKAGDMKTAKDKAEAAIGTLK